MARDNGRHGNSFLETRRQIERSVLGSLLRGGDVSACHGIDEESFHSFPHRIVFRAVMALQAHEGPILVEVAHRLMTDGLLGELGNRAGVAYSFLADLFDAEPTAALTAAHAADLRAILVRERLDLVGHRLREAAAAPDFDCGRACDTACAEIGKARDGAEVKAKVKLLPPSFLHDDLLDAAFPPQVWLLDSILPAGALVFLGGKKKLGKSWLCLQIAQAVAAGAEALGRQALAGDVCYLGLEDGDRRLQDRLKKQGSPRGLPIRWFTTFDALDAGGMGKLVSLLETSPRLVVIDTLAAAKSGLIDENASGPMSDLGNGLRRLAQRFSCAILVTHHHGKHSYGDPGDDLRGSSAIGAAADLNLGLYREEGEYHLLGEGRDIEEFDWRVSFDANASWQWSLLGDARVVAKDAADSAVLVALANLGEADAAAVAAAVNRQRPHVCERLNRLATENQVLMREDRSGKGRPRILYRLPPADAKGETVFPLSGMSSEGETCPHFDD